MSMTLGAQRSAQQKVHPHNPRWAFAALVLTAGILIGPSGVNAQASSSAPSVDPFAGVDLSASMLVPIDVTPHASAVIPVLPLGGGAASPSATDSANASLSSESSSTGDWEGTKEIAFGLEATEGQEDARALPAGRISAGEMPPQMEKLLLKSFLRNEVLLVPPQSKERFESRELREAWEGNLANISTGFDTVVVRFRKEIEELGSGEKDPPYFDIRLTIREKQLLIQHTEGQTRRSKEGLEFAFPPLEQERQWIAGKGRTGMTVLLPRIQLGGQYARALMLCPRNPFNVQRGARQPDDTFFVESPYKVARTMYSVRGRVEGRALSGGGVGLAKAEILTTPNIARSKAWEDSSYGVDPSVALTYLPFTSEQLADVEQDGSIVAAIEGRLTLQRPAGFKRVSIQRAVLWLKEVSLSNDQPWFIRIRGDRPPARVAPGRCYSLLIERFSEQRYTREEFVLPERLK